MHVEFLQYTEFDSIDQEHGIVFTNCCFSHNIISSVLSVTGELVEATHSCSVVLYIEFINNQFICNGGDGLQSHIIDVGDGITTAITFKGCLFHNNTNVQLVEFVTGGSVFCSEICAISLRTQLFL